MKRRLILKILVSLAFPIPLARAHVSKAEPQIQPKLLNAALDQLSSERAKGTVLIEGPVSWLQRRLLLPYGLACVLRKVIENQGFWRTERKVGKAGLPVVRVINTEITARPC